MKTRDLIELLKFQQTQDYEGVLKDFKDAIWVLNHLSQGMADGKVKTNSWDEYLGYFLLKWLTLPLR